MTNTTIEMFGTTHTLVTEYGKEEKLFNEKGELVAVGNSQKLQYITSNGKSQIAEIIENKVEETIYYKELKEVNAFIENKEADKVEVYSYGKDGKWVVEIMVHYESYEQNYFEVFALHEYKNLKTATRKAELYAKSLQVEFDGIIGDMTDEEMLDLIPYE